MTQREEELPDQRVAICTLGKFDKAFITVYSLIDCMDKHQINLTSLVE